MLMVALVVVLEVAAELEVVVVVVLAVLGTEQEMVVVVAMQGTVGVVVEVVQALGLGPKMAVWRLLCRASSELGSTVGLESPCPLVSVCVCLHPHFPPPPPPCLEPVNIAPSDKHRVVSADVLPSCGAWFLGLAWLGSHVTRCAPCSRRWSRRGQPGPPDQGPSGSACPPA